MDHAGVTASGDSVAGGLWEWFKSYTKRGGASWGEYYLNGKIFDRANWATFDVAKEDRLAPIAPTSWSTPRHVAAVSTRDRAQR